MLGVGGYSCTLAQPTSLASERLEARLFRLDGWSELRKAVETSDVTSARSLVASGQDVNGDHGHEPQRFSLLHHAIDVEVDGFNQTGTPPRIEMIELLLDAGANPTEANYLGETPLDMARGHPALEDVIKRAIAAR